MTESNIIQLHKYSPKVTTLWSTPDPAIQVARACSNTQKGLFAGDPHASSKLIEFVHKADHGSTLEHAVISFDITNISRSCADQLRTHRMASWTMSSTHYQDHSAYPHFVGADLYEDEVLRHQAISAIHSSINTYVNMTKGPKAVPVEEARQMLPLSSGARMILTINARSLTNLLKTRMCYRNTTETVLVADLLWLRAVGWFPELFKYVGKPCDFDGCKEGKMQCDKSSRLKDIRRYA